MLRNGLIHSQPSIACSKLTIDTIEQGTRNAWRRSGVFIVNLFTYFTPCSSVSFINFDRVNACLILAQCYISIPPGI